MPDITPETRIGELVAARPGLARLFSELRIDYCCGGKISLAAVSESRGLSVDTFIAMLKAADAALGAAQVDVDAANMSLKDLTEHVERTHHAYLKDELPRLVEMAQRVAYKHSHRDQRLTEMAETVTTVAQDMISHMQKEEQVLFPLVRQIEADPRSPYAAAIAEPIRRMESEHDDAGRATERLRELTDGFTPDCESCNTHRALLHGLARFEEDLHRHVHKENNVMFPRALALAGIQA